jgi:hypothetical protein
LLSLKDGQLVAKGENLEQRLGTANTAIMTAASHHPG